jgi:L-ascorbate metabolism protein UlaG (beta-lactamase superfamily)
MLRITYVGHGTVLLEGEGMRVLTDPLLRERALHLRRIAPLPDVEAVDRPDVVVISHAHFDHLDTASLRMLHPCPVVAPRGCGRLLRRAGFRQVIEVRDGDHVQVGGVELTAARMEHYGRRHPASRARESLGYVIGCGERVFFAGDTDLFDGLRELAGGLDLALLPIWGWGPRVGRGHMDPAAAAHAAAMLAPRFAIPIHWGTYASPTAGWIDDPARPAREFEEELAATAPAVEARVLPPGGTTELRDRAAGASWPRSPPP